MSNELKYKVLGFNDEQCECDVCGKQELKGTYAIENLSTGEIFRAGSSCGAKMAGWTAKELVLKLKESDKLNLDNAKAELRNSIEYIEYEKAIEFLNKESEDLEKKMRYCSDEDERRKVGLSERSFESRRQYLSPFRIALDNKKEEILKKYNITKNNYLN